MREAEIDLGARREAGRDRAMEKEGVEKDGWMSQSQRQADSADSDGCTDIWNHRQTESARSQDASRTSEQTVSEIRQEGRVRQDCS